MALLNFGDPNAEGSVITGVSPEPGGGTVPDPSALVYSNPNVSGAITGVVNGLSQSVEAFFRQLPVEMGIAAPAPVPTSPFGFGAGGLGIGTIALIGVGVYLLSRRR